MIAYSLNSLFQRAVSNLIQNCSKLRTNYVGKLTYHLLQAPVPRSRSKLHSPGSGVEAMKDDRCVAGIGMKIYFIVVTVDFLPQIYLFSEMFV